MATVSELRQFVDWERGLISPAVLFDEDVYRQEQERVFGHSWLVVGHEDMIRKPGDYVTNYMGESPVILVRDMKNQIRVLNNKCVHRGNQVCLYDRGNARAFTCSYHGFTYDLTGDLIGVPMEKELYKGELVKAEWGLDEVPRVTNFHGMIFANFDAEAPSLEKWLGEDGCWWLENFVLAGPVGGLEALPGWHRYWTPGNWKHLAENFIGDDYHVGASTHVSWFKVIGEMAKEGRLDWRKTYPVAERRAFEATMGYTKGCPIGLGLVDLGDSTYEVDLQQAAELGKESLEWVKERHNRLSKFLQDNEEKPYGFMNGAIFPNLGLMGFGSPLIGRHFLLFQPRGPWEMEQWQWTMVEKEAPAAVKELAAQRVYQGQHMAGGIAPDDVENLERIVETMRSPRNWERPHNYLLQLGHETEGPTSLPGNFGPNPSEVNQREFYRFWLELMEAE